MQISVFKVQEEDICVGYCEEKEEEEEEEEEEERGQGWREMIPVNI